MSAINKPHALDDIARNDSWLAQDFETNTGTYDVHNGIDRADFMKMHLSRGQSMNFSFSDSYTMEDRD